MQGLTGDPGSPGEPGIQGVQGLTGDPGSPGVQGLSGEIGLQGLTGEIGLQGVQGDPGVQGLSGEPGTNIIGTIASVEGATSPIRVPGIIDTPYPTATYNSAVIALDTGHLWVYSHGGPSTNYNDVWLDIGQIAGSTGLQGTEGSQGIQGTEGSQGIQGLEAQGIQGIDGGQGIQGIDGGQGVQGIEGSQGIQGTEGSQGVQGTEGSQGLQGLQGPSPTVAYGSTIRAASVTSAGTSTVTIDFSQDGIILIKDPTNSPTIAFTNITAGKRCSVILQNTTTDSIIVNTGVPADQAVSGSNSVLNRGRQSTFLEYVCYSNVSTGVFLIVDPY